MGISYTVSPLHRMASFDPTAIKTRAVRPDDDSVLQLLCRIGPGAGVAKTSVPVRSPTRGQIVAWRDGLSQAYRDRLSAPLQWDEDSSLNESEEIETRSDVLFRFTAALLDLQGPSALRELIDAPSPSHETIHATLDAALERGFGGQFPHLLLGPRYWLPYADPLILEAPDWYGCLERYGSVPRLRDEIHAVRDAVREFSPRFANAPVTEASPSVLSAAWATATTIARIADLAVARQLPLWTV